MFLNFSKNVFGSESLREKLPIYKDGRTAILYDYNGDILKYYKNDTLGIDITITESSKRYFKKMKDLRMFAVPKAKYYEYGRYSGIIMDKIDGPSLMEVLGNDGLISDKIVSGYLLSRDLETLNRKKLVWGDVHLENIVLGIDGNCYGVDIDEVFCPKRDVYPFMLYEVVSDYADLKGAIYSDKLKFLICMFSYIFGIDLQSLIKIHGIKKVLQVLDGNGILEYVFSRMKQMVEVHESGLYYHEMVDELLSFGEEELANGANVLQLKIANSGLQNRKWQ